MSYVYPADFVEKFQSGQLAESLVIDVRELQEWHYYHLEGTVHQPMRTIPETWQELPADRDIYVICAHGVRSAMVVDFLHNQGLTRAINVAGGMAAVSGLLGFEYD